ncbi:MAG TPA: hypothetical protein VGO35_00870 [Gammaproteobacteria bacterium]|jgi:hypothetical protein|nr:hypothetical protein [Gammaproteobacteria bacterium]
MGALLIWQAALKVLAGPPLFKRMGLDKHPAFADIRGMDQFVSFAALAFACMCMCMMMHATVRAGAVHRS